MDGAKKRLLETTLQSRFDLQNFIMLTRELLKSPKIKNNPVFTEAVLGQFRGSVKAYTDFGIYQDSEGKELLLLAVQLIKNDSVARSRAMQRNFIKEQLQKKNKDAALVAFFEPYSPDWRLSFVKIDYNFVGNTLEEDITPARRYSFLVGENEKSHTAMRQLAIIIEDDTHSPTLTQIEEIFNIEKVTDEFFKVYREKYLDLKECLEKQAEFLSMAEQLNFTGEEFAKKLMGQLSFLYFLQRKGWLGVIANPKSIPFESAEQLLANKPANMRDLFKKVYSLAKDKYLRSDSALKDLSDQQIMTLNSLFVNTPYEGKWGTGEKNFIRTIFYYADKTGQNFYRDYLEPLFYNALNEERGGNTYYRPFNCMIPFLNGGLFQPISERYDLDKVSFKIQNDLFSNNSLTKEGDKGDGILDIFDRYAFTVKEDEPLEKEVAVDPEMLGKVFENLLEVKDRKSKGAFYTPREIVHYMCQESLINYLVTETGISYEDINKLIRYGDIIADADNSKAAAQSGNFMLPESIRKNAKNVDDALDDIRIADPAVGSGAFPLGMINEIVRARMNLTLYLLPDEYVFSRDYAVPEHRKPYNLKLRTIQHSIHAVDIERSAVEITKLRLWLSLVVDEENFSEIRPLPNLEYNIMCGNSLLEEFEGIQLFNEALLEQYSEIAATKEQNVEQMDIFIPPSQNILDKIYVLQEKFFATSDSKEKSDLKKQIDEHEWDLIQKSLIENGKTRDLPKIRELKRLNSKPYFLWKLNFAKVFRDKGGFDIVIANPPYVGEKGHKEIFRPLASSELGKRFYKDKMDLYYFFMHKAIDIVAKKGYITFITTNYYITASGACNLRDDIKKRTSVLTLMNFNELRIFDSARGQHSLITILRKGKEINNITKCCVCKRKGNAMPIIIDTILNSIDKETSYFEISELELFDENNIISISGPDHIIEKMNAISSFKIATKDIGNGIDILQEFVTDKHLEKAPHLIKGQGVFALTTDELKSLNLLEYEKQIIKPYYTAEQLLRYGDLQMSNQKWIIYTTNEVCKKIDLFPNIKRHLDKFQDIITSDNKPYGLHRARNEFIFKGEKVLSLRMTKVPRFTYSNSDTYVTRAHLIIKPSTFAIDLKFLVALLNSSLMYYWFYFCGKRKGEQLQIDKDILLRCPLVVDSNQKAAIIMAVNKIINYIHQDGYVDNTESQNNVIQLEKEIDQLIYATYNLTSDEIEIVENFIINH